MKRFGIAVVVSLLAIGALCAPADAAAPQLLWQTPEDAVKGESAGRLDTPRGIAKASNGDELVADLNNSRIDEFDVWGQFVKAFGWGVVASGPDNEPKNERQELSVNATGGSFALRFLAFPPRQGFSTEQTGQIAAGASASAVQGALEGLISLNPGDVAVSGPNGGPWTIEFTGARADADIAALQPVTKDSEGNPTLTGGAGTATVTTLQEGANFEICVPADGDVCRAGQPGAAPGHISEPNGVAMDAAGNVYVDELAGDPNVFGEESLRVQKFDPEDRFLLMFGGEVDKTSGADLCTRAEVEGGDVCGAGVPGAGDGQFAATTVGNRIAIGPEGKVFVGDVHRIERFSAAGAFEESVEIPGETVRDLAMDSAGDFYVAYALSFGTSKDGLHKLSPAGAGLGELSVEEPEALAVDAEDHLFAVEHPHTGADRSRRVVEFDSSGNELIPPGERLAAAGLIGGLATGSACGMAGEDLYSDDQALRAFGPPPDPGLCPPPARAPSIADQFVAAVDPEGATVRAKINPHFWPDAEYFVEYGTGKCSESACGSRRPTGSGSLLTGQTVNAPVTTAGVFLPELEPDTTYHYRFVAESSGGGPVRGLGGEVGSDGGEGTFHTFSRGVAPEPCPNDAFRAGFSSGLPDCRAYEMVSPVDKEGGDIAAVGAGFFQAATERDAIAYSSYRPFAGAESASYNTEYLSARAAEGWTTEPISPPRGANLLGPLATLQPQFKLFSPDLCQAWLRNDTDSLLAPGAVSGFTTVYRRQNCAPEAGAYTALGPLESAPPKFRIADEFIPKVQAVSADGTHTLFKAADRLTESGPDLGAESPLLYESFGAGKLRMVCILPNGSPVGGTGCSAGSAGPRDDGTGDNVHNAISSDGSHVFWSDRGGRNEIGKLYVRINGKNPTIQITSQPARFQAAAADGSKAVYTIDEPASVAALFEFDVATKATTLIAHGVEGVLGVSEDANRIYFVSKEALAAGAEAGSPNLYLYDKGAGTQIEFIGNLSAEDTRRGEFSNFPISPVAADPSTHVARVSADGEQAVFMSTSRTLSEATAGYDNTDANSGESDAEVYRYDAGTKALNCLSCNPTGARPSGRALPNGPPDYWAAAFIQPSKNDLYAPRVLSADGSRVFFEGFDALVPDDTNGRRDVYEWELPGVGGCSEAAHSFVAGSGGCVSLISSGTSSTDSTFIDSNADGTSVYFTTAQSLLPQDPGLVDLYDARVNGGFPSPSPPSPPCEGEACQSPPGPPVDSTPGSLTFQGPGNPRSPRHPHCRKGKHRSHGKCVKNHRKQKRRGR